MARKKGSDTLRQRKFAQQEFLKLKKMQQGELDAGPKPSELAKPLTFGEKVKNIWYHDKFALSVIAIIIVAIAALCVQCATKTVYDANIVLFSHEITGDAVCEKMAEYFIPYCPDLNGDGEVNVNVVNCSINPKDKGDYSYTNRSKMQSLLANDASFLLFITDDTSYKEMMKLSKEISLFEGEPLKLNDDFYEFCSKASDFYDVPDDLQISCRTIKGAAIQDDKNVDKYYKQAQKILKNIKKDYDKPIEELKTENSTTNTAYDNTVVLFTSKTITDEKCKKISEYLSNYCPDFNFDGIINLNVINCSLNFEDKSDQSYIIRQKVNSLIATDASALLFITDDSAYNDLMNCSDKITFFEGEPFVFDEKLCENIEKLQISCRTLKGTAIEKDKNIDKYYEQAQKLLEALKNKQ